MTPITPASLSRHKTWTAQQRLKKKKRHLAARQKVNEASVSQARLDSPAVRIPKLPSNLVKGINQDVRWRDSVLSADAAWRRRSGGIAPGPEMMMRFLTSTKQPPTTEQGWNDLWGEALPGNGSDPSKMPVYGRPTSMYTMTGVDDSEDILGRKFGGTWSISLKSAADWMTHPTPALSEGQVHGILKTLDNKVRFEIDHLNPKMQRAYNAMNFSVVSWKRHWYEVLRSRGVNPKFNPNNAEWDEKLDAQYHAYLWGRVAPYAVLGKDEERNNALAILQELHPDLVTEAQKSNTDLTQAVAVHTLTYLNDLFFKMGEEDETMKRVLYEGYIGGRLPGQSDIKARWDYVHEFGVDSLPNEALMQVQEENRSFEGIMGGAFGWLDEHMLSSYEKIAPWEWAFNALHDKPGAIGDVASVLEKFTKTIAYDIPTGMLSASFQMDAERGVLTFADVMLDSFGETVIAPIVPFGIFKGLEMVKKGPNNPELEGQDTWGDIEKGLSNLTQWHNWTKSWKDVEGSHVVDYGVNEAATHWGFDPENEVLRTVVGAADIAADFWVAAKFDRTLWKGIKVANKAAYDGRVLGKGGKEYNILGGGIMRYYNPQRSGALHKTASAIKRAHEITEGAKRRMVKSLTGGRAAQENLNLNPHEEARIRESLNEPELVTDPVKAAEERTGAVDSTKKPTRNRPLPSAETLDKRRADKKAEADAVDLAGEKVSEILGGLAKTDEILDDDLKATPQKGKEIVEEPSPVEVAPEEPSPVEVAPEKPVPVEAAPEEPVPVEAPKPESSLVDEVRRKVMSGKATVLEASKEAAKEVAEPAPKVRVQSKESKFVSSLDDNEILEHVNDSGEKYIVKKRGKSITIYPYSRGARDILARAEGTHIGGQVVRTATGRTNKAGMELMQQLVRREDSVEPERGMRIDEEHTPETTETFLEVAARQQKQIDDLDAEIRAYEKDNGKESRDPELMAKYEERLTIVMLMRKNLLESLSKEELDAVRSSRHSYTDRERRLFGEKANSQRRITDEELHAWLQGRSEFLPDPGPPPATDPGYNTVYIGNKPYSIDMALSMCRDLGKSFNLDFEEFVRGYIYDYSGRPGGKNVERPTEYLKVEDINDIYNDLAHWKHFGVDPSFPEPVKRFFGYRNPEMIYAMDLIVRKRKMDNLRRLGVHVSMERLVLGIRENRKTRVIGPDTPKKALDSIEKAKQIFYDGFGFEPLSPFQEALANKFMQIYDKTDETSLARSKDPDRAEIHLRHQLVTTQDMRDSHLVNKGVSAVEKEFELTYKVVGSHPKTHPLTYEMHEIVALESNGRVSDPTNNLTECPPTVKHETWYGKPVLDEATGEMKFTGGWSQKQREYWLTRHQKTHAKVLAAKEGFEPIGTKIIIEQNAFYGEPGMPTHRVQGLYQITGYKIASGGPAHGKITGYTVKRVGNPHTDSKLFPELYLETGIGEVPGFGPRDEILKNYKETTSGLEPIEELVVSNWDEIDRGIRTRPLEQSWRRAPENVGTLTTQEISPLKKAPKPPSTVQGLDNRLVGYSVVDYEKMTEYARDTGTAYAKKAASSAKFITQAQDPALTGKVFYAREYDAAPPDSPNIAHAMTGKAPLVLEFDDIPDIGRTSGKHPMTYAEATVAELMGEGQAGLENILSMAPQAIIDYAKKVDADTAATSKGVMVKNIPLQDLSTTGMKQHDAIAVLAATLARVKGHDSIVYSVKDRPWANMYVDLHGKKSAKLTKRRMSTRSRYTTDVKNLPMVQAYRYLRRQMSGTGPRSRVVGKTSGAKKPQTLENGKIAEWNRAPLEGYEEVSSWMQNEGILIIVRRSDKAGAGYYYEIRGEAAPEGIISDTFRTRAAAEEAAATDYPSALIHPATIGVQEALGKTEEGIALLERRGASAIPSKGPPETKITTVPDANGEPLPGILESGVHRKLDEEEWDEINISIQEIDGDYDSYLARFDRAIAERAAEYPELPSIEKGESMDDYLARLQIAKEEQYLGGREPSGGGTFNELGELQKFPNKLPWQGDRPQVEGLDPTATSGRLRGGGRRPEHSGIGRPGRARRVPDPEAAVAAATTEKAPRTPRKPPEKLALEGTEFRRSEEALIAGKHVAIETTARDIDYDSMDVIRELANDNHVGVKVLDVEKGEEARILFEGSVKDINQFVKEVGTYDDLRSPSYRKLPKWIQAKMHHIAYDTTVDSNRCDYICQLLGIHTPDIPPINGKELKSYIRRMEATSDPQKVFEIAMEIEDDFAPYVNIDVRASALIPSIRFSAMEKAMLATGKMGPLGYAMQQTVRTMGSNISYEGVIPDRNVHKSVRSMSLAVKMGRKKMDTEAINQMNLYAQRMWDAKTSHERASVIAEWGGQIKRNMIERGVWDKFEKDQLTVRRRRANVWVSHYKEMMKGYYAISETGGISKAKVRSLSPDWVYRLETEIGNMEEQARKLEQAGDVDGARFMRDSAKRVMKQMDEDRSALELWLSKKGGKFTFRKKKKEESKMEFDSAREDAERAYNDAAAKVASLGTEQPVFNFQLMQKQVIPFDPRLLAWYQAGGIPWNYVKLWDANVGERWMRLFKEMVMSSVGFPIRVFAGDEFWRLPLEGIMPGSARWKAATAMSRKFRGGKEGQKLFGFIPLEKGNLSRKERKRYDELEEPYAEQSALLSKIDTRIQVLRRHINDMHRVDGVEVGNLKKLPAENKKLIKQAESDIATLNKDREKYLPICNEFEDLQAKCATTLDNDILTIMQEKLQMDMAQTLDDSFTLVGPNAGHPDYAVAFADYFNKFVKEPIVQDWIKSGAPKDRTTIRRMMAQTIEDDTPSGRSMRQLLADSHRIRPNRLDDTGEGVRQLMKSSKTGVEYTNVSNLIDIWTDAIVKVTQNEALVSAAKRGFIATGTVKQLAKGSTSDLWAIPMRGQVSTLAFGNFRNPPDWFYKQATLPILTYFSRKTREALFGEFYLRKMDEFAKYAKEKGLPSHNYLEDKVAHRIASESAAEMTNRATFTRNATVFEDMARNVIPFLNSYRQFWIYWTKMLFRRPFTMGVASTLPERIGSGQQQIGPLTLYMNSLIPFFLQTQPGEDPQSGIAPLMKGIYATPSVEPIMAWILGGLYRDKLGGDDPTVIPGMKSSAQQMAPFSRLSMLLEGVAGIDLQSFGKDASQMHSRWYNIKRNYMDRGKVSPDEKGNLPFPLNLLDQFHNGEPVAQFLLGTFSPVSARVNPTIPKGLLEERTKYYKILDEQGFDKAGTYLNDTKYYKLLYEYQRTTHINRKIELAEEYDWLPNFSGSNYEYDLGQGDLWTSDTSRKEKDWQEVKDDIKNERLGMYGGQWTNVNGELYNYPGDPGALKMNKIVKKHLGEITKYAQSEALAFAGGNKDLGDEYFSDWKERTRGFVDQKGVNNTFDARILMPRWYEEALIRDGKEREYWHPGLYVDSVGSAMGTDYSRTRGFQLKAPGRTMKPPESTIEKLNHLAGHGFIPADEAKDLLVNGNWPGLVGRYREKIADDWTKHTIDLDTEAYYNVDVNQLEQLTGKKFGMPLELALRDIRKFYYDTLGSKEFKKKNEPGSREYRNARLAMNEYKDNRLRGVPGGELFRGGVPERLLQNPALTMTNVHFVGPDAKDDTKLWRAYLKEARKDKPNNALCERLKRKFDAHLWKKWEHRQAVNNWVRVCYTAKYMRSVMETSWSDYYQGPGNSVYTKMGTALVDQLYALIRKEMKESPIMREQIRKFFDDDPKHIAWTMLDWYYH